MPASISEPDRLKMIAVNQEEPSLTALVGQVVDDARGLVGAEVALAKAKVAERVDAYKGAAVLFAVAAVLALAVLIAGLVGIILSLATLIGPGFATLAVVGAVGAIAAILAMLGARRLRQRSIGVAS